MKIQFELFLYEQTNRHEINSPSLYQGEYVCEAVNTIGGERRVARSEAVKV